MRAVSGSILSRWGRTSSLKGMVTATPVSGSPRTSASRSLIVPWRRLRSVDAIPAAVVVPSAGRVKPVGGRVVRDTQNHVTGVSLRGTWVGDADLPGRTVGLGREGARFAHIHQHIFEAIMREMRAIQQVYLDQQAGKPK